MAQLEHDTDEVEASRAPLLDHLIELRSRLVVILAFLSVGFIVCFIFSGQIYQWLLLPYRDAAASVRGVPVEELDLTANFFAPLEFFFVRLKLSLVGAIIIGFPVIAWQIYGFVAPSLQRVVAEVLGEYVDKSLQRSDWDSRPLSCEQLRYAALDAAVL